MKFKTAESVTIGHPDKLSDYIADSILDACMAQDPDSRVACEVMLSHDSLIIAGEITTKARVDYRAIAEAAIRQVGYDVPTHYYCDIVEQSPDIKQAVDDGQAKALGAGDQGIMYGYATNATLDHLPLAFSLARRITRKLSKIGPKYGLGPDGKAQVTVAYEDRQAYNMESGYFWSELFSHIETIVVSVQHSENMTLDEVRTIVATDVIVPIFDDFELEQEGPVNLIINPSERFVFGGFKADTGLTGRKLMVDSYGGIVRNGGGAMSGKDPSKVDRSGAYMARYIANTVVQAGIAEECEVSLAYAIGQAEPVMVEVDTHGTWITACDSRIAKAVKRAFDLTPAGIISTLGLKHVEYKRVAAFGHFDFCDRELPWENPDKAVQDKLLRELKQVMFESRRELLRRMHD